GGMAVALGGVVATGVILALVGLLVNAIGIGWVNWLLPPVVTGSIVMIIGLNLAGAANNNFKAAPLTAIITLAAVAIIGAVSKGFLGRMRQLPSSALFQRASLVASVSSAESSWVTHLLRHKEISILMA
ncbi:MAG: hypothetical protein RLZ23_1297, partial [Actinomycetota bacterium]